MKFLHNIDLANTARIINIPSPASDADLVTKGYVSQLINNVIAGFDFQSDVKAVQTDATLVVSTPTLGDRYIITNIADLDSGFGSITGVGNGDIVEYDGDKFNVVYDVSERGDGVFVYAQTEKQYYRFVDSLWSVAVLTASTGGSVTAGNGLTSTGDVLSVNVDGTFIEITGDGKVTIKDGSITKDKLAFSVISKFAQNIGDGTTTSYTVSHGLATKDAIIQVYDVATGATVMTESTRVDATTATVTFSVAPATDAYRVVVIG